MLKKPLFLNSQTLHRGTVGKFQIEYSLNFSQLLAAAGDNSNRLPAVITLYSPFLPSFRLSGISF
ncbi:MAG: hypothetical protein OIF38_11795, partial [Cellvibrionaceae bacterium]|nr:hypothetical protein [Cellvibrionaceae bacterium]